MMTTPRRLTAFRRSTLLIVISAMLLALSGCLKTRAQLRDDSPDDQDTTAPQPAQVQPVQPQGGYVIDEIKAEMTRMNGRIEDLERAQKQQNAAATAATNDDIKKLDARVTELEKAQAQMLEAIQKIQQSAPPADPQAAYRKAKAEFDAGNYDAAIQGFTEYLKVPNARHAEEATFLRGESYFAQKDYKKAIVDYSKFPEKFTHSKKMPAALYKIGLSFDALGMKDDAKGFYHELVDKFPRSSEAKKAKAKLRG